MRSQVKRTAEVIERQARLLGYEVETDAADTGSRYLSIWHSAMCNCREADCDGGCNARLIRVADHEANEGRYAAHLNAEPDVDVRAGYQVEAVAELAAWIGRPEESVGYLRAAATRREREAREIADAAARQQAANDEHRLRYAAAQAKLAPEHQATFAAYDLTMGKARKNFRKNGRYRRANEALDAILAADTLETVPDE